MTEQSYLTTLIGDEIQGDKKWWDFVDGEDGFLYGIPCNARRVVKFDPLDKSLTEIGPDLGEGCDKWTCGVRATNGSIYCAPFSADHILKIDTIRGTVETLDDVELPETGGALWMSGALAPDNYIYYMPFNARRIMRLNPDNDSLSSVGDDLGQGRHKYSGTVVGNDNCLYGIPFNATFIVKFDPTNPDTTSTVGEEGRFRCWKGVLGGGGDIYAANRYGQVLKVDTANSDYTWIGDKIYLGIGTGWFGPIVGADECIYWPPSSANRVLKSGWGGPIVGADKCIYWPPSFANRVLKFDHAETHQLPSLVGSDLGGAGCCKWLGGALASDGVIYCTPHCSKQILAIDPFKEMSMTLQNNFRQYPEELGRLFVKDEECNETFYKSAARKFGSEKVFKFLVEECLPSDEEWADSFSGNLPLFMVAASCENSAVSVIYHLLRRNMHDVIVST
jgi:hypothetical protein